MFLNCLLPHDSFSETSNQIVVSLKKNKKKKIKLKINECERRPVTHNVAVMKVKTNSFPVMLRIRRLKCK